MEGFEPLLQFAYTSKLLFTKENVLEIRTCATVLGFKNLDKACFDFLLPKFFDSSKSASKGLRKQCCKTRCWRSKVESNSKDDEADKAKDASLGPLQTAVDEKELSSCSKPGENTECVLERRAETEPEMEAELVLNYPLLCPKYRKFQRACGKVLSYMDGCGPEAENTSSACPLSGLPCSSSGDCEAAVPSKSSPVDDKEDGMVPLYCPLAKQLPAETPLSVCPDQTSMQICREAMEATSPANAFSTRQIAESPVARLKDKKAVISGSCFGSDCPSPSNTLRADCRSSVEIEVANQLTSLSGSCSPRAPVSSTGAVRKASELHWLRQLELGPRPVDCPFLRDLGAVDAQVRGSESLPHSAESTYISMNSGEDSDGFDTEGDSESYTRERASEVSIGC